MTTRDLDATGLLLLALLAALALVAGAAFMDYAHVSPWGLAGALFVIVAFAVVGLPHHGPMAPKNTLVHGAAKPASESEAQAAARGDIKAAPMHGQTFPD
jgi:hypothetical protein